MKNFADRQALLVPYSANRQVRHMGATWEPDGKYWWVPHGQDVPRKFLPLRDRPNLDPPYIRINLIPQTSWGKNLRAMMPRERWQEFARTQIYASTGSRCLVCAERGPQWPVEADEIWKFDENKKMQTLAGIVPLCPDCHSVRTCGFAVAQGREKEVVRHLAWIERISHEDAQKRIQRAISKWEKRSRKEWAIDISYMKQRFNLSIDWDVKAANAANKRLRQEAAQRTKQR